jgi:hypothetical protein
MPGQYKFTGNPKVAMYQPRGLEYFSYLPQLKAKVKGAAISKAEEMNFNYTGLAPQDLEPAKAMNEHITRSKDGIVEDLMGGDSVTDSTVDKLYKLAGNKRENNEKMNIALNNAQARQKFRDGNDATARATNRYEYYNKINDVADQQFGSTFLPDGTTQEFNPDIPVGYVDIMGNLKERLATAMPELSEPGQMANFVAENIEVQTIELPGGKKIYKGVYKKPMDKWSNKTGLNKVLMDYNAAINDVSTEEGAFAQFMGPDYMKQFSTKYLEDVRDTYLRTDLRPGQMGIMDLGNSGTSQAIPPLEFPTQANTPKDTIKVENNGAISTNTTPTELGVSPVITVDSTDPENVVAGIEGVEEYVQEVDKTTKFLFGPQPLTLNDLVDFSAYPADGTSTRFDNNLFATAYKQALENHHGGARTLNTKIEQLRDLLEEQGGDINDPYKEISLAVSPQTFTDLADNTMAQGQADIANNQNYKRGVATTLIGRTTNEERKQKIANTYGFTYTKGQPLQVVQKTDRPNEDNPFITSREDMDRMTKHVNTAKGRKEKEKRADYYGYRINKKGELVRKAPAESSTVKNVTYKMDLNEVDQLKNDILKLSTNLHNELVVEPSANAFKFYESSIGTLASVVKSDGTRKTVDEYDSAIKEPLFQSINEGAETVIFDLDETSASLTYNSSTGDEKQLDVEDATKRAIRQTQNVEGLEGNEMNELHPTLSDNRMSVLLGENYFSGTEEQRNAAKAEMDEKFKDAFIFKTKPFGETGKQQYIFVQNKIDGFGYRDSEVTGYVGTPEKPIRVNIPDAISKLTPNNAFTVNLAPGMQLQYAYGNGGGITMNKVLRGTIISTYTYSNKAEAEAQSRQIIKTLKSRSKQQAANQQ